MPSELGRGQTMSTSMLPKRHSGGGEGALLQGCVFGVKQSGDPELAAEYTVVLVAFLAQLS